MTYSRCQQRAPAKLYFLKMEGMCVILYADKKIARNQLVIQNYVYL